MQSQCRFERRGDLEGVGMEIWKGDGDEDEAEDHDDLEGSDRDIDWVGCDLPGEERSRLMGDRGKAWDVNCLRR